MVQKQCWLKLTSCGVLQTAFAKWGEGQKDRPKQAASSMEAHKARAAAAAAASKQQTEAVTVKPVKKGEKKQPLELHPDQFVRIKARKAEDADTDEGQKALPDVGRLDLSSQGALRLVEEDSDIEVMCE